jgi:hypothetical protein
MSFGFSVGDFLAIIRLADDVRGCFVQAPKEYKAISGEYDNSFLSLLLVGSGFH